MLPPTDSREDVLKIARARMPHGEPRNWKLLASYVIGTEKKQASGIVEALASATYHASKMGRDRAEFSDIEWVLAHEHDCL